MGEIVEQKHGIKEVTELLEGLQLVAVSAKKVMADGKVGVSDFPVLMETMKNVASLSNAVAGADQIPAEIKDLSEEEAKVLLAKLFGMVAAIKAA